MKNYLIIILLIIFSFNAFSNNRYNIKFYLVEGLNFDSIQPSDKALLDSLLNLYHKTNDDTLKLQYLDNIVENCYNDNVWPKYNDLLYDKSSEFIHHEHTEKELISIKSYISIALNNKAYFFQQFGNIKKGIEYFMKSLKICEEIGDLKGQAQVLDNVAVLLEQSGASQDEIVKYHRKALKLYQQTNRIKEESSSYVHIGYYYYKKNMIDSAIYFMKKGLDMKKELNDLRGLGNVCYNLSRIYLALNNFDEAINYLKQSHEYFSKQNDLEGLAYVTCGIGNAYFKKVKQAREKGNLVDERKYLNIAEKYALESKDISKKINYPKNLVQSTELLFNVYELKGDWRKAYSELYLFWTLSDSLNNASIQKAALKQKLNYEHEKKLLKIKKEQEKIAAITKVEERNKNLIIGAISIVLVIVVIFSFFLYHRFQINKRQKKIIEQQKNIVEEKNKEIIDSIRYAKRIQSAILPPQNVVKSFLQESFILYKPKDIVAGDFYWLEHVRSNSSFEGGKGDVVLFAAADCTGHGVPGAMVSVVCNNGLNRSVREHGITEPGNVLDRTREIVIQEFEKSEDDVKDGMDIALCSLTLPKIGESGGGLLRYAGANNPLWVIRKGAAEVLEIKGDKQPIGKVENPLPFTTHTIELQKGDTIYIFSDGLQDQFGGGKGKKFKRSNFKKLLLSSQNELMQKQRDIIDATFEEWRGDLEQVDDVCVIGVRI